MHTRDTLHLITIQTRRFRKRKQGGGLPQTEFVFLESRFVKNK